MKKLSAKDVGLEPNGAVDRNALFVHVMRKIVVLKSKQVSTFILVEISVTMSFPPAQLL